MIYAASALALGFLAGSSMPSTQQRAAQPVVNMVAVRARACPCLHATLRLRRPQPLHSAERLGLTPPVSRAARVGRDRS